MSSTAVTIAVVAAFLLFIWFWHSVEKQLSAISHQLHDMNRALRGLDRRDEERFSREATALEE